MESLDLGFRMAAAATMALVAAIMIKDYGQARVGQLGALFLFSTISYLFCGRFDGMGIWVVLGPLFYIGCYTSPLCFWLFVRAIFDDSFRVKIWHGAVFLLFLVVGFGIQLLPDTVDGNKNFIELSPQDIAFLLRQILALVFVLHALALTGLGREEDLIEKRRKIRVLLVSVLSVYISLVIIIEIFLSTTTIPLALDTFNVASIWALTFGLAILFLGIRPDSIFSIQRQTATAPSDLSPADSQAIENLLNHIERQAGYQKEGLTITELADYLTVPVHRLRHLINAQLGFRNFSEFINSYRIAEACRILADSEKARLPVLTIALDLGFGSIGPFNRAFKTQVGQTPTQYRQAQLALKSPDTP